MIGKLKGVVDSVEKDSLILDVSGVGYEVFCSGKTLAAVGDKGSAASLLIETHVREDHIHLYGFRDTSEREAFRILQTVQGIGAKLALAILSVLAPNELFGAIARQDKTALSKVSGVGPKLAQRMLTELKDKAFNMTMAADFKPQAKTPASSGFNDAVSALVNLGISRMEAHAAVNAASGKADNENVENLIKLALVEVGR